MPKRIFTKTKEYLFGRQDNIMRTSFIMMIMIFITKLSGFLYRAVIGQEFGLDRSYDLFLLANTIPEILGNFILVGVISAVLVPILVRAHSRDGEESFLRLWNSLLNFFLLIFVTLGGLFIAFAPQIFPIIIGLINSKFEFSNFEIERTVSMMRWLMLPQVLLGISAYYTSALSVYHRFIIPQLSPLVYNLGRIFALVVLKPYLPHAEDALVVGTILGAFLHLIIQYPLILKCGVSHSLTVDTKDPNFVECIRMGGPRILSVGGEYLAMGIDRFIAARFVAGSVSAYEYATQLVSIPLSLFGMTFSVAAFPQLSKLYQTGEHARFNALFIALLNKIFFLSVPCTVIILVLRVSLVRLFYGIFKGSFDFEDTYLTAWIVLFLSFGLTFLSVKSLIYRAFYSTGDTVRPLYASIFTIVMGVITGIIFANYFSHFDEFNFREIHWSREYFLTSSTGRAAVGGIALSSSIVAVLEFFLLLFMLSSSKVRINMVTLLYKLLQKTLAGTTMAVVMFIVFKIWGESDLQSRTFGLILLVSGTSAVGLVTYAAISYLLKIEELSYFTSMLVQLKKYLEKTSASINSALDIYLNGHNK